MGEALTQHPSPLQSELTTQGCEATPYCKVNS